MIRCIMRKSDTKIGPLVSVIIPVYNASKYIENTIESILNQTYQNFEIIVVDDGSTDTTVEKVNEIEKQDTRIKLIKKSNGGCPSARNLGIENADGVYLQFVDSDDTLQPNMLFSMLESYNDEIDLVICGHNRNKYENMISCVAQEPGNLWRTGKFTKADFVNMFADIAYGRVIGWEYTWDKLYRKDIINKYHIKYNEELRKYGDDSQFSLDYIDKCENIYLKSECLYNFRLNIYKSGIGTQTSGFRDDVFNIQCITLDLLRDFLKKNQIFDGEIENGWKHMYVNEAIKAIYLNYRDDSPYSIEKRKEIICEIKHKKELQNALTSYVVKTEGEDRKMPKLLLEENDDQLFQYLEWKVRNIYK